MDLYQELDLPRDCSFDDIKQQYRILAGIHHPDKGGDEEKFKKIKFAYEVLSDPDRRSEYDKTGNTENAPDIKNQARHNLSQIFFGLLPNFDPTSGDIIEIIKHEITVAIKSISNNKTESNTYITKLELVKSKIRKKDTDIDPDNLFYSFIDSQLEARRNDLNTMDKRVEIAKEMLKILDGYSYGYIELPVSGGGFKHDGGG